MNIQDLEQKYKELGAEIQRLKQQPEGVWEPTVGGTFWTINSRGEPIHTTSFEVKDAAHHTAYKTKELAKKASVLQLRSNLVIQACLNFDPEFVPDWEDLVQQKYGFSQAAGRFNWRASSTIINNNSCAYVSTREIANKVVDYLNSQEIK